MDFWGGVGDFFFGEDPKTQTVDRRDFTRPFEGLRPPGLITSLGDVRGQKDYLSSLFGDSLAATRREFLSRGAEESRGIGAGLAATGLGTGAGVSLRSDVSARTTEGLGAIQGRFSEMIGALLPQFVGLQNEARLGEFGAALDLARSKFAGVEAGYGAEATAFSEYNESRGGGFLGRALQVLPYLSAGGLANAAGAGGTGGAGFQPPGFGAAGPGGSFGATPAYAPGSGLYPW